MKHTPGPWRLWHTIGHKGAWKVEAPVPFSCCGKVTFICQQPWEKNDAGVAEQHIANGRLIAASVDLFDVVKWVLNLARGVGKDGDVATGDEWTAALNKAENLVKKVEGVE